MKPEDRRVSRLCDTGEMKGGAGISVGFGPYMIEVLLFAKILQTKRKKNISQIQSPPFFSTKVGRRVVFFESVQEDGHESGRSDDW